MYLSLQIYFIQDLYNELNAYIISSIETLLKHLAKVNVMFRNSSNHVKVLQITTHLQDKRLLTQ